MLAVLSGFPVSFSIAGVAVIFAYLGWTLGVMNVALLGAMAQRAFGLITNTVLIAIPVFRPDGCDFFFNLEKSRIAEELLDTMGRSFGQLRGGLGISVVLVGALLAPSTGIVGATVVANGHDRAAQHAARGLQPLGRLGDRLHRGHAGADHPALDAADHPRGCHVETPTSRRNSSRAGSRSRRSRWASSLPRRSFRA